METRTLVLRSILIVHDNLILSKTDFITPESVILLMLTMALLTVKVIHQSEFGGQCFQ